MEQIVFDTDGGLLDLGPETLVFALDDTGNESFKDPKHPVFGIAGCGFMVRDYTRLIDAPWGFMCNEYFKNVKRPLHASEIKFGGEQINALNHFFKKFQFFRIAVTADNNIVNQDEIDIVNLIGGAILKRIEDVGKWIAFDRIFIMFESSQRIEDKVMRSLSDKEITLGNKTIPIELAVIPKSACMSAMEVADFIAHTSGRQARVGKMDNINRVEDFKIIFNSVDERLVSFMHVTKVRDISA